MGDNPDNPGANQQPVEGGNNNNVADQRCPVINVSPPAQLIMGDSPVENWKLYKQAWSNYKVIAGLELRTEEYRKALFLHNLGREAQLIYNSKDLPLLKAGDVVRIKPFKLGDKIWKKGEVIRRLNKRSYLIRTDEGTFRRNRKFLRQTAEQSDLFVPYPPDEAAENNAEV
ncbi:hypothetical protein LOTGIDRAFT_171197 [Lottia gigantea]|uniref:Uncharacterized protein n=1 Tax=Lottia gigantea TaxID=225164 RepID=V4B7S1_LOTGI|nr:hypothetical protein LOTGIDRAFT_171197 [Lottia gigantea]ESP03666.1 hypothetical protein LOTGIDRAFT_171197 [Lottia gigantea]